MTNNPSTQNKMGTKPLFPLLISMSLPVMLSMFIQAMYNVVDSIFVAKISDDALMAVSLAFPLQNLILAVAVGTGVGINSLIARRLGEKRNEEANSVATHGFLLSIASALLFALLGIFFTRPFFSSFTDSQNVIELGCQYTYIVVIFSFGIFIHIAVEKILQATGNMFFPMLFQLTGAVLNLILDPIMIFGLFGFPKLGIAGAALATVIGQICAMLLAVFVLVTKSHEVKLQWKGFHWNWTIVKDIYVVGFPSILMQSITSILVVGLNAILITLSNAAVSVMGIYFKLQSFVFMPVFGLVQGAMPIMGYNYGAKNKKRLLGTLRLGIEISIIIMTIGLLVFQFFPTQLITLFNDSPALVDVGVPALRIISWSFLGAAIGILISTYFQAIGRGFYSLLISILRQLIIILPLAFVFAHFFGLTAVWLAFPLSEIIATLVCVILFLSTHKKLNLD